MPDAEESQCALDGKGLNKAIGFFSERIDCYEFVGIHGCVCGGRDIPFDGFRHVHTQELEDGAVRTFLSNALNRFLYGTWYTDRVDRDTINRFINTDRLFNAKERKRVQDVLNNDGQDRVNLLRFREILTMLVDEGRGAFRGEHYVKFAKLTEELNKLVDEVEAQ